MTFWHFFPEFKVIKMLLGLNLVWYRKMMTQTYGKQLYINAMTSLSKPDFKKVIKMNFKFSMPSAHFVHSNQQRC